MRKYSIQQFIDGAWARVADYRVSQGTPNADLAESRLRERLNDLEALYRLGKCKREIIAFASEFNDLMMRGIASKNAIRVFRACERVNFG